MRLHEVFTFYKREEKNDGMGNTTGEWKAQFTTRSAITYREGNEAVIAARLEGRQPAFIVIRKSETASQVTPDWMCKDIRTNESYNIRSVVLDVKKRQYYRLTIERGIALG